MDIDRTFSQLSDDVILKILFLLEDDPRSWARLSCVSNKFCSLISTVCCKTKCISTFPSLSTNLLSLPPHGGAWSSLYKIAVCCPGLHHSGVLLDHSDFGLLRDLGPHEAYQSNQSDTTTLHDTGVNQGHACSTDQSQTQITSINGINIMSDPNPDTPRVSGQTWTLYDDLYLDSLYDNSETTAPADVNLTSAGAAVAANSGSISLETNFILTNETETKRRKKSSSSTSASSSSRLIRSHLASGIWNLSREQGNKLLASRFRDDCLYISDWPGCIHMEEKRNYMVFRGVFKNFKRSKVWRTINDGQKRKVGLNCAFCECKDTWDLHSAFCLKRGFGFHDDGEPVVRAYVCENGHVSGAWTDLPLYG